jgi:D-arginine dehydrogenase
MSDVVVIGGGIAGVSIGYELAADRRLTLIEMEHTLAFHTTGRSVATFLESYGGRTIRLLTSASRAFMTDPPDGFHTPLLTPLPLYWVARHGREDALRDMRDAVAEFVPDVAWLTADEVLDATVVMRPEWVAAGLMEPGASEIDVAALHQGYTSGLRARGGEIVLDNPVVALARVGEVWQVRCRDGSTHAAPVVVNAAGSWVDLVGELAGARPIGIHPLRRTVFTISPPADVDTHRIPLTGDEAGAWYFKPEGEQVLCSPADELPSDPCDARPEEVDIAAAIDVLNDATTLDIRHVRSSWAGLRNFVADRSPVAGFDDHVDGLFWFAGQGGYGIQMAPALARAGAGLVRDGHLPSDVAARGLDAVALGRTRLDGLAWHAGH